MFAKVNPVLAASLGALAIHMAMSALPRAMAASPSTPKSSGSLDIAVERCAQLPTGGIERAQHAYPGMSAAQLSQVRALGHFAQNAVTNSAVALPGYPFGTAEGFLQGAPTVYVRDGMVTVICGSPGAHWFDEVTFTLAE